MQATLERFVMFFKYLLAFVLTAWFRFVGVE